MSTAPQPGRQKQPPSPPTHPPQQMMPARPPPRPAPYPPRYYRPPPSGPSPSPKLGWTPRTAASPHTPVTPRTHSRAPASAAPHHAVFSQPTPAGSPRLNVSTPGIAKPGTKPSISPIPISPNVSAHTPSWLKGNYKPQTPKTPSAEPATAEHMCKKRLEDIKATVTGDNENTELFDVMQKLEFGKIPEEYRLINEIRDMHFQGRERKRKADLDLFRVELELSRLDHLKQHADGKIARLRSYAKFIESGWVDEEVLQQKFPAENGPKSAEDTNGDHYRSGEDSVKHEDVKHEDVKHEDVKHEDVKQEYVKHEDVTHEDVTHENVKQEDAKQEDVKQEDFKKEDVKQEDVKQEDIKQEDVKEADVVLK